MTSGILILLFVLAITIVVGWFAQKNWESIRRVLLEKLSALLQPDQEKRPGSKGPGSEEDLLSEEERSEAELRRLHRLVEGRKSIARKSDIAYHLWNFYQDHFRNTNLEFLNRKPPTGEWYDVRIRATNSGAGVSTFQFSLNGRDFTFIDDEEKQSWRDGAKSFSLSLFDDEEQCLIEIPMRTKVEEKHRKYFILSSGPTAFLPGPWISEFTNAILKHQSLRNKEIRARMHEERLREIEELKDRFGIDE